MMSHSLGENYIFIYYCYCYCYYYYLFICLYFLSSNSIVAVLLSYSEASLLISLHTIDTNESYLGMICFENLMMVYVEMIVLFLLSLALHMGFVGYGSLIMLAFLILIFSYSLPHSLVHCFC